MRDVSGGDLFIVDNSDDGWTGLRYLQEWSDIATSFDIATGYFDIASLLALDGKWQQLETIRILMGVETTSRTARVIRTKGPGPRDRGGGAKRWLERSFHDRIRRKLTDEEMRE